MATCSAHHRGKEHIEVSANWICPVKHRKASSVPVLAALAVLGLATSACGSSDSESDTAQTTSTSAAQVAVAPAPTMSEGDLSVALDPCTVSDATISEIGFDPSTRDRSPGEIVSGMYTAIGCTFSKSASDGGPMTGRLTVLSTSTTLAEIKTQDAKDPVSNAAVDGRPAVTYRPSFPNSCTTAIETTDGTLTIEAAEYPRTAADGSPAPGAPDPCGTIETTAAALARSLK